MAFNRYAVPYEGTTRSPSAIKIGEDAAAAVVATTTELEVKRVLLQFLVSIYVTPEECWWRGNYNPYITPI